MGVAPSRVKEGTGEGQTTDGWQLEGTADLRVGPTCHRRPCNRPASGRCRRFVFLANIVDS